MTNEKIVYPPHAKPMAVARQLIQDAFTQQGHKAITYWQQQWWVWNGKSWHSVDELTIKEPMWNHLENAWTEKNGELVEWSPTPARVGNIMEPLQILARAPREATAPMWIADQDHDRPDPAKLVSLNNGVIDLTTGTFREGHTPALFNTWHLPFDFDPDAGCPIWKNKFLKTVFEHDRNAEKTLQEFAGYYISGRKDLQKGLAIVGPSRAGKGTISRTVQQLVGLSNVVSPSLNSLGGEFGMQDLIDKPLAVIEDARSSNSGRSAVTVERLLSVIGEDAVSINRKNKDYWNGTLPTRFMLVSNEVPRLGDASGAVVNRFIYIKLKRSFEGIEDTGLGKKIAAELPGIFNWALEGLHRLDQQGHFTQPATMNDVAQLMSDLSQPVANFLDDSQGFEVTRNPKDWVLLKDIHTAYKTWCEQVGAAPLKQANFGQALDATDPDIDFKNSWEDSVKARRIYGVKKVVNPHAWINSKQSA